MRSDPIRTKDGRVLVKQHPYQWEQYRFGYLATPEDIERACGTLELAREDNRTLIDTLKPLQRRDAEHLSTIAELSERESEYLEEAQQKSEDLRRCSAEVERLKTELSEWQTHERMPHEYVVAGKLRDEVERLRARVDLLQRANGANDDEAWGATISAARAQRETERLRRVVEAVQRVMRGIGVMGKDGEFVPPMTAYGDLKQALAALPTPAQSEPTWFKPDREEYSTSPLLHACENAGMTAEQALDELAKHSAAQLKQLQRALLYQFPAPIIVQKPEPAAVCAADDVVEAVRAWQEHSRNDDHTGWSLCLTCDAHITAVLNLLEHATLRPISEVRAETAREERERCAVLADDWSDGEALSGSARTMLQGLAETIRAMGDGEGKP